jgi:hypothetical protein
LNSEAGCCTKADSPATAPVFNRFYSVENLTGGKFQPFKFNSRRTCQPPSTPAVDRDRTAGWPASKVQKENAGRAFFETFSLYRCLPKN